MKILPDVQTISDYYNDEWLNYDLDKKSALQRTAEAIIEGYRDLTEALEDYESKKDTDFSHFIALGYPVTPDGLKWAIDFLTKE